ncbi:flagellin [Porticoccaceae bacterium]|nr:flagellin [Porticoccaceae bacterium]
MKIGTNITASIAANSLAKNERAMAQSMQRLSTGLRINSAADDAAGLAIASRMTSQARGLDQAVQNANDAIGMIQTADDAVASVTAMLQRMGELSVQAANDTNTSKDRSSLDLEYQALKAEIERVFNNTQWNGENLLDGSHFGSTTSFQIGANSSQKIDVSLGNLSINRLGGTSVQTGYMAHASAAPTLIQTTAPVSSETPSASGTWTQRGADIDGANAGDYGGFSVSMSADKNTIAMSAVHRSTGGINTGQVRMFDWNGSAWIQRGSDINGEAAGDKAGWSISLSTDGNTIAIGARYNDGGGSNAGHVRIYDWSGGAWTQRGTDIDGESSGDEMGQSVALSSDTNTLVVGSPWNDGAGANSGSVRVYDWNGTAWNQRGTDIDGESSNNYNGQSVSISANGSIIAMGAVKNNGNAGHVRIYSWDGSAWVQLGADIDGETAGDEIGQSIALTADGNSIVMGAQFNDGGGSNSGHARVFDWNGSDWVQRGTDIDGERSGDYSGISVSITDDGNSIAIGARGNDDGGSGAGQARVYNWDGSAWVQRGSDIDGESSGDGSAQSLKVSGDGITLAVGALYNDNSNGSDAGHVRVYDWPTTSAYTAAISTIDFNNLNLITGDRITIDVIGDAQVQGIIGADGLDALLTSMALQIAAQTGLYGGASASSGVINVTGLADGNPVSGLTVTLEKDANNYADSLSPTNISTAVRATSSLTAIDRAMTQINSQMGAYGAAMNRLEYAIDNLTTMAINVRVSLSRIQDADYAKETTELARTQIIQQAATAMLAQANQQAKMVMDILNWDK